MAEIVFVDGYDWVGLYINGKLVDQGHSFNPSSIVETIFSELKLEDNSVNNLCVDVEWLNAEGYLPEKLSQVKLEK